MNQQTIEVYDNGGTTPDRYTVVISTTTGLYHYVFRMSHDPDGRGGVNEDEGSIEEFNWRRNTFGDRVDLDRLPVAVKDAIEWRRQETTTRDWEHIL